MKKITLPWMNRIRERLKEAKEIYSDSAMADINEFISPVVEYGEKEEERISIEFEETMTMETEIEFTEDEENGSSK